MGKFGEKFRQARERKQLSLDDVSNVTKISARSLQAIEEEHFDQLPGGVFNKGFIRAYAKHLGLDSEDAVSDYLECLREAQIDAHEVGDEPDRTSARSGPIRTVATKPAPMPQPPAPVGEELPGLQLPRVEHVTPGQKDFSGRVPTGIPWGMVAAVVVLVAAALFFWNRRPHIPHTVAAQNGTLTATAPSTSAPTSAQAAPFTPQNGTTSNTEHSTTPQAAPKQTVTVPAATHASASAPASAPPPASKAQKEVQQSAVQQPNNTSDQSLDKPIANVPNKTAKTLSLVIRATENSWVSVSSDGQLVTQETLIAPANTTVHALREIVARIGNAAGVTFIWNGAEIPAQGGEAEVKTFVFDAQGMREIPSQPTPQN